MFVRKVCSPRETHAIHLSLNSISACNTEEEEAAFIKKIENGKLKEIAMSYAKESEESDSGEAIGS